MIPTAMSKPSRNNPALKGIEDLAKGGRVVPSFEYMKALPHGFQPGPRDVICARGKRALESEGNRHMRTLVDERLDEYCKATTKIAKSVIVSEIVDSVREASPNGGFVKEIDGRWFEVGDNIAREKIGQRYVMLV